MVHQKKENKLVFWFKTIKMESSSAMIKFRIKKSKKDIWKKLCSERKVSLTQLIIDSVEGRIMDNERREILMFIKKQDNIFIKIETNINQMVKVANAQRSISDQGLKKFSGHVTEVIKLKQRQNEVFRNIYKLLAK